MSGEASGPPGRLPNQPFSLSITQPPKVSLFDVGLKLRDLAPNEIGYYEAS